MLRADGTVRVGAGLNANGLGGTQVDMLTQIPNLSLVSNASLFTDGDCDELLAWQEYAAGTDPLVADSNGNGLSDLVMSAARARIRTVLVCTIFSETCSSIPRCDSEVK